MASMCGLSASTAVVVLWAPLRPAAASTSCSSSSSSSSSTCSSSSSPSNLRPMSFRCSLSPTPFVSLKVIPALRCGGRRRSQVVCMAPEEEKMTRRSPLDFPIEWERPKPGRRPDIFPQFSPMKTPLPPPLPADPPEEDEEEEEKKEEEEEDPEKEEQDNPEQQQ